MLISKEELEQIIKEEIEVAIDEGFLDRMFSGASGLKDTFASKASGLGAKAMRALGSETAAGEMEQAAGTRASAAKNAKKLGLMKSHAQNFSILSKDMIRDAQKLGFAGDANFKKALAASKAVATRLNNIILFWEKDPGKIPSGPQPSPAAAGLQTGEFQPGKGPKADQDSIPTQSVPKDDLDALVAARQKAGSPAVREAIKRIIKEEIKRLTGEE